MTRWQKPLQWLAEQRQSREKRAWLTLAAKEWAENGRLHCDLLRARALKSVRHLPLQELSHLGREFIKESRADADRRRLRLIAAALVLVLLTLLGLYWKHVELKETLARMMLERGERQLEARDPAGAALWFQEALNEAVFNKQVRLVRIGCALRQIPTLLRLQPQEGLVNAEFNTDGRKVVLAARKQDNGHGGCVALEPRCIFPARTAPARSGRLGKPCRVQPPRK